MIDDEIKESLQVEPSPEFGARLRARIAREPQPSSWRWSWTLAASGAIAAALVVALVVPRLQEITPVVPRPRVLVEPAPVVSGVAGASSTSPPADPVSRSAKAFALPAAKAFALPAAKAFPPPAAEAFALPAAKASALSSAKAFARPAANASTRPAANAFASSRAQASAQPEILLDPAETRALRALIASVRDGRIDLPATPQTAIGAPMDLEPLTDIVIAPIAIEPLAPQGAQGERQ